ncbi:MAG: transglutaminase domain-containing protein [Chloroflexota bacterium]
MQTSSAWRRDGVSVLLLLAAILTASARLVATDWAPFLYFTETMALLGVLLGLGLGMSRFSRRAVGWLGFAYTAVLLPWQMTAASGRGLPLAERLAALGERLGAALWLLFQREPVEDTILFLAFVTFGFWLVGLYSGYGLARHGSYLAAALPAGTATVIIQVYDSAAPLRLWFLAVYAFISLILLGRMNLLKNRESWDRRKVFQMPDAHQEFTNGALIGAAVIVLISWSLPLSIASFESAARGWRNLTRPFDTLRENLNNAVEGLDAPGGRAAGSGDFYGETLPLGRGTPLSDQIVFTAHPLDEVDVPRFYWRGRAYDHYENGRWDNTSAVSTEYTSLAEDLPIPDLGARTQARFTFQVDKRQSLLYTAAQPVWVDQGGSLLSSPVNAGEQDIFAFFASPALEHRDTYESRAALANPSVQELRAAGSGYPAWIAERYLQLPDDLSPRIPELAAEIAAGQETPYDRAAAITAWLRREIEYEAVLAAPPQGSDPLAWMLFEYKKGFCFYYATAEIMMLRSLGIPARMAVGFSEGELDEERNLYTVRRLDYHAWPEVYFPGIGWVEFEPTASQRALQRPLGPRPVSTGAANVPTPQSEALLDEETLTEQDRARDEEGVTAAVPTPLPRWVWAVSGLTLVVILWILDRRIGWVGRVPVYIESRVESAGGRAPRWISAWAAWTRLAPIERAFQAVNLSLRWLGEPAPSHATPRERAERLVRLMPRARAEVQKLTGRHEAALFAREAVSVSAARLSALKVFLHAFRVIIARMLSAIRDRIAPPAYGH